MDVEEKNEETKPPDINVNLEPGRCPQEREKRELLTRVEESEAKDEREQEKAGVDRIGPERREQDAPKEKGEKRREDQPGAKRETAFQKRTHRLSHLESCSTSRMSARMSASCGQARTQAGPPS